MAKVCDITGKRTVSGNRVSHSNNKVRRKFYPNLHKKKIYVNELDCWVCLNLCSSALRSIDNKGAYTTMKNAKKKGTLAKNLHFLID